MLKTYTPQEVAKHNHENDLWIVYNDGVYDITKFLQEHPGGEEVLVELAGKDATKCFDEIGHTTEAEQLRENYKIGTLTEPFPEELDQPSETKGDREPSGNDQSVEHTPLKEKSSNYNTVMLLVTFGIVFYSIFFYSVT